MRPHASPTITAWTSRIGLVEEYAYPSGRAGTGSLHVHRDLQICLSLDFPGRYLYRGTQQDVPVGAVSILDAWEPHASSDPCERDRISHYIVLYVDPVAFRRAIDASPAVAITRPIRTDVPLVRRFRALYRALRADHSVLQQEERYQHLAHAIIVRGERDGDDRITPEPARCALAAARDYIAANATQRVTLQKVAAHADLTPWHLTRAFHRRFGVPPHRFQMLMRIDRARRLLTNQCVNAEVAQTLGFADEAHFIRWFKRIVGMTPAQYRKQCRRPMSTVAGAHAPD
jgi:AraC-like DNA-binding protein